MFADTVQELQLLTDRLAASSQRIRLDINIDKTKLMIISEPKVANVHKEIKINKKVELRFEGKILTIIQSKRDLVT